MPAWLLGFSCHGCYIRAGFVPVDVRWEVRWIMCRFACDKRGVTTTLWDTRHENWCSCMQHKNMHAMHSLNAQCTISVPLFAICIDDGGTVRGGNA